jgi:PAS domain S-box-containing protein
MAHEIAATILVVDDNPAGRYATSRVLRAAGFAVLEAASGSEGLVLAAGADLVVLDVNLPDVSGFEVCRRIRSTAEMARLPVIHLSATFVRDTDKVEGLDAGADGYLTHPVEPPVLIATVNAFLRARRAEDEMRKSEAKFKAIFDQALSGILLISKDLVYLEANPAMCRILGRQREEIIGRHGSVFVPAGFEGNTLAMARDIEEIGAWRGTFPLLRADGSYVELDWSIARYTVPGVRLAIVNDVTERKAHEAERERLLSAERAAREEAERANRLKDEFLATLSHELRTPLNAIVGWSQILKDGQPSPAEVAEGIDAIERNAQSQAQLISDLLDVSRITSGKLRLNIRSIDPADVIHDALETMAPAIQAKEIRLLSMLAPDAGPIQGDPDRLQQVIWNLVNNAVKFTPRKGTIRVTSARANSHVAITISDDGQGIKPDFLPYIFERFRQEDATTKRNQGGLGLGLAIVKHLIEMHGGTVSAHSEGEGRGTTFVVRLPVTAVRLEHDVTNGENAAGQPDVAAASSTLPPATGVNLGGVRVLVVEDDSDARAVLRRVLAKAGADVRDVPDVPAALAIIAESMPDVLISDIGMPHEDGFDLIRKIRNQGNATDLPAIALTAFARSEDRQQSLQAGFQLHLSKPVDAEELLAAVASLILPYHGKT